MTFRYDDRVKVTTSGLGTGVVPFNAPAASGGFRQLTAIAGITSGDVIPYTITDGTNFENGYGTWSAGTGMTRSIVKNNSAGTTAKINFSGLVTVMCNAIAASLPLLDQNGDLPLSGNLNVANGKTITGDLILAGSIGVGGANPGFGSGYIAGRYCQLSGDAGTGGFVQVSGFGFTTTYNNTVISCTTTFSVVAGGSGGVALTPGNTSWVGISDERLKDGLEAITNALDKVCSWRTVTGYFIDDTERRRHRFLIAQDVQRTSPEAVYEREDGTLMLSYTETIPDIVAAIKELAALIKR